MFKRMLIVGSLSLLVSVGSLAQDSDPEKVRLPDNVKRQIAARILRYQFKPRRTQTSIPLAESQVKREWLPKIKNVTFELVPDEVIEKEGKEVFLLKFDEVEQEGNRFTLSVGWGNFCDATGDLWDFIVERTKVRLWPINGGWGSGCASSTGVGRAQNNLN